MTHAYLVNGWEVVCFLLGGDTGGEAFIPLNMRKFSVAPKSVRLDMVSLYIILVFYSIVKIDT